MTNKKSMVKRTQARPINIPWPTITTMGPNFMYNLLVAHTCAIHTSLFEPFRQLTCLLKNGFMK